jgi:hypothetical protein
MFDTAIIDQASAPRAMGHFCRVSSSAIAGKVVMPRARIASMIGSISVQQRINKRNGGKYRGNPKDLEDGPHSPIKCFRF